MRAAAGRLVLLACATASPVAAQQTFTGRITDNLCKTSHRSKAAANSQTDRQCVIECLKALAKYAIVLDADHEVVPIANQDAMGLPFYADRLVKVTGERKGDALVISKIEAVRQPEKQ